MAERVRETIEAADVAQIMGVSEWTVYDLARRRIIPHIRIGRRVLFRRSTILSWLEAQEKASLTEPVVGEKIKTPARGRAAAG